MEVLTHKIKVLLADDEPAARKSMETLLKREKDVEVKAQCRDGKEAVEAILHHRPDLVFLDIQMPKMDGFAVLKSLSKEELPVFIFVTAFEQYALKAFELTACDYLLKPYDDERFYQSLDKARAHLKGRQSQEQWKQLEHIFTGFPSSSSAVGSPLFPKRLALKSQKRISFVEVEDIWYVESEGNFVKFHTKEGVRIGNFTFKQLQDLLDPEKFIRIHKSFMVNIEVIQYLEPYFHGDYFVFLKDGQKLRMSRNYKDSLSHLLG